MANNLTLAQIRGLQKSGGYDRKGLEMVVECIMWANLPYTVPYLFIYFFDQRN